MKDDERTAYCPHCNKQTKQFKSSVTGRWYCQRCGRGSKE
jgi:ribosomal protein L37AE/L43A